MFKFVSKDLAQIIKAVLAIVYSENAFVTWTCLVICIIMYGMTIIPNFIHFTYLKYPCPCHVHVVSKKLSICFYLLLFSVFKFLFLINQLNYENVRFTFRMVNKRPGIFGSKSSKFLITIMKL